MVIEIVVVRVIAWAMAQVSLFLRASLPPFGRGRVASPSFQLQSSPDLSVVISMALSGHCPHRVKSNHRLSIRFWRDFSALEES